MSGANAIELGTAIRAPLYRLLSDERLARRSAAGDTEALALLFERHHQAVYRYCRAIVRDAERSLERTLAAVTSSARLLWSAGAFGPALLL